MSSIKETASSDLSWLLTSEGETISVIDENESSAEVSALVAYADHNSNNEEGMGREDYGTCSVRVSSGDVANPILDKYKIVVNSRRYVVRGIKQVPGGWILRCSALSKTRTGK